MKESIILEEQIHISELYNEIFHGEGKHTVSQDEVQGLLYYMQGLRKMAGNSPLLADENYLEMENIVVEFCNDMEKEEEEEMVEEDDFFKDLLKPY